MHYQLVLIIKLTNKYYLNLFRTEETNVPTISLNVKLASSKSHTYIIENSKKADNKIFVKHFQSYIICNKNMFIFVIAMIIIPKNWYKITMDSLVQ